MAATVALSFVCNDPLPAYMSQCEMDTSYNRSTLCTPIQDEVVFTRAPSRCCVSPPLMEAAMVGDSLAEQQAQSSADARRASILQQYFKSTSALARSILLEKASVEEKNSEAWSALSVSRRDAIVDSHFVPMYVREQYEGGFVQGGGGRVGRIQRMSQRRTASMQVRDERYGGLEGGSQSYQTYTLPISKSSGDVQFQRRTQATKSMKSRSKTEASLPSEVKGPNGSPFARNKLQSYSMRMKKGAPGRKSVRKVHQLNSSGQEEDEIIPLFERDVNDLDTEIDLPDESLLTDHLGSSGEADDSPFARLKPLRYSVGRKLRNKVEPPTQEQADAYVINNPAADMEEFNHQNLSPTPAPASTPRITSPEHALTQPKDLRYLMASPTNEDMLNSLQSPSYPPSTRTQDYTVSSLGSQRSPDVMASPIGSLRSPDGTISPVAGQRPRGRTVDMGLKHPLSHCAKAGSRLTRATSEFADRSLRFRATQKRRAESSASTRDNTPVTSPTPQQDRLYSEAGIQHNKGNQQDKKPSSLTVPIIRNQEEEEYDKAGELQSPITSPPDSPAATSSEVNRRESGYISSPCDAMDDEDAIEYRKQEMLKPVAHRRKRRQVDMSERPLSPMS